MDSKYYQKIEQYFICNVESYMNYYLSFDLLQNNIKDYIDYNKFNQKILNILDQHAYEDDDSIDSSNNLSDEENLSLSINEFINELKPFYEFNKNISEVREDIFTILMDSTTEEKIRCVECGTDMGQCNPRQYCGKLYCLNPSYESDDESIDLEYK